MSLLARYLDDPLRAALSGRATPGGVRLEDVIRSGMLHTDSAIGVYAPDPESYEVFRELFDPILEDFRPSALPREDLACVNPAAVVSTRVRVARNLVGHPFPAGMSRRHRLDVQAKIARACDALASEFKGWSRELEGMPPGKLEALISMRLAFGPGDKYMAAARIHSDWPVGRSIFITRNRQVSVWINEEDHLRVGVVMPGASIVACSDIMGWVLSRLAGHLDFCVDTQLGHLTSCPSNVGSGMRASYMVDLRLDNPHAARLAQLESAGVVQVRGASGEHSTSDNGHADIGFRQRVGLAEARMLQDMLGLLAA